jgi:rRNA maturation protein Nop10
LYRKNIKSISKYYDLLKQALKRNEPMKLKTKRVKVSIDDYRIDDYCPTCDEELYTTSNYCPHCGQKLDWSDDK